MVKKTKDVLLIVDDDLGIQKQLKWNFTDYEVVLAEDKASAIAQLRRYEPAVVTLDLGLPPDPANASEGLATLEEIMTLAPKTKVIVITGNDDKENALKAIEMGACDFYQKPVDADTISVIVERAFHIAQIEKENQLLKQRAQADESFIGNSPQFQHICRMVEKIAPTEVSTLLLGESGTGKEVLARAIHDKSPRKDEPFIAINCASIPETLLESELFGFERGAFTGAHKTTKGKIELAEGGTLFLDEIGDMPHSLQAKLLRFLQERVLERLGGRTEIPVNVKVICATHQNLQDMVQQKTFREDLFYRISEITINIPALRERDGDVVLLARAFLHRFNQEMNRDIKGFSDDALQSLMQHQWPGNIRELQNKIKSAVIMADGKYITDMDLGLFNSNSELPVFNLREIRESAERRAITQALSMCNQNISKTAEILGITRPTLYSLVEKHHLTLD